MGRVVVVGSINHDIVVRVSRHPVPGETLLGTGVATFPGGKGANQAVAAARSGAVTLMIGRVGGDDAGRVLTENLQSAGVDVHHVGVCQHDPTGTALITVADSGENTIVVVGGANEKIRPVHVDDAAAAGAFERGDVVLAQLEIPVGVVERAFVTARHLGCTTVLNAAPAQMLGPELLSLIDVLVVNETELAMLSATPGLTEGVDALRRHVGTVVVTLGAAGVFAAVGTEAPIVLPGHSVDVVDTTGAGDAFCGALCAALAHGMPWKSALERANATAALACTKLGAQTGLPDPNEVDHLLGRASL